MKSINVCKIIQLMGYDSVEEKINVNSVTYSNLCATIQHLSYKPKVICSVPQPSNWTVLIYI